MRMRDRLKDLFIPHEGNDFKPNFLERVSIAIMLILIVLSFTLANLQALLWMGSEWMVSTILPAVIVDLTNEERTEGRIGTLRRSSVLDRAATLKAKDMAKHEYFSHYSPTGVSPWHWFDEVSYDFVHAGENLAVHFTDSKDVVTAWMESPGHRANILNGEFVEIGVGTAEGEYKGFPTIFVVQLFGTPAISSIQAPTQAVQRAEATPQISLETVSVPVSDVREGEPELIAPATLVNATEEVGIEEIPPFVSIEPASTDQTVDVPMDDVLTQEIADSKEEGETISLYSDLATATRPGIPATIEPTGNIDVTPGTSLLLRSATQPGLWLTILYGILAAIVVVSLLLSIVIEWRRQHPVQIVYAGGLLAIMALLFYIHSALTSGVTIS